MTISEFAGNFKSSSATSSGKSNTAPFTCISLHQVCKLVPTRESQPYARPLRTFHNDCFKINLRRREFYLWIINGANLANISTAIWEMLDDRPFTTHRDNCCTD